MPDFLVIGDVHGHLESLAWVLEASHASTFDAILLVGDLAAEDDLETSAMATLEAVSRVGVPVLFVPGNHDLPGLPDAWRARDADGRVIEVAGISVRGIGGAGPGRFGFPYEWDEPTIRLLPTMPAGILLCHAPPARCSLDRCHHGAHAGSTAIRERLRLESPEIMLCGHIHEAAGLELVDGVPCFNVGALGAPFGAPQFASLRLEGDALECLHQVRGASLPRRWSFARRLPSGSSRTRPPLEGAT
jgi:hypothetical protein